MTAASGSEPKTTPAQCASMAELRALIDRIDVDLVTLLALRQDCIDRAAVLKPAEGIPARVPSRIDAVLTKVRGRAVATGLDPELAETLWRAMIERAIAREERAMGAPDGTGAD